MKRITLFLTLILSLCCIDSIAQDKIYDNTFNLGDVQLLDGPFKHALDLNTKVLLEYDMDRLLAPFLKEAGLEPKAPYFPNWEGLDGHIGGHYVAALAIHFAATGNQECYKRLEYMLSELKRAQDANGNGYIGGVPDSKKLWAEVKKGNFDVLRRAWVPWYNVHKLYAGLRAAWVYAGSREARDMFLKMCDWALYMIEDFTPAQMEDMLGTEFGGMNEVLADAYLISGDRKYMDAARRWTHHQLFDAMVQHNDNLDNKHANTQVPKEVGFARVAKIDSDPTYKEAARFFWDRVSNHRSVVIGGNSRSERFPAADDYQSFVEHREGPESCNTHNMLKLTEFLFSIDPLAEYADFYEKAMYNHILSTQHPEHGGYVYFTSMRPSHYRVYSQVNSGMWCCIGTGMENHGKYGEFIYTHDGTSGLYVNLFVASRLNWTENSATITQETNFPFAESSKITVNLKRSKQFKMYIRCPGWTDAGYSIKVNGKEYAAGAAPQSYIEIDRKWKNGDVVEINLPMKTVIEELENVPQYLAVKKGPIVLAARTGTEHLDGLISDDGRWAHIASGPLVPIAETPIMVGTREQIEQKIFNMQPVPGKPLHYTVAGLFNDRKYDTMELEPFFYLHDSRYAIYFLSLTREGFDDMLAQIRADEAAMLALDARTVDKVTPGEQQPEADHRMLSENSSTGNESNQPYRTSRRGGFFSYELETRDLDNLALSVGYWGNETTSPSPSPNPNLNFTRSMDILVDDELIISETAFPTTGQKKIERKEYVLPKSSLQGKKTVRVTFRCPANAMGARIFDVRLVKEN